MEHNINKDNELSVGDTLSDKTGNKFTVLDLRYGNTHTSYASEVLIECYGGPRKGVCRWVSHEIASQFKD